MNCAILTVGDELLTCKTLDTNSFFIRSEMQKLGFCVKKAATCGDNKEQIKSTARWLLDDTDILICSGGLGPTDDDLTREAISELLGRKLMFNLDAWASIKTYFLRKGLTPSKNNEKQAMLPFLSEEIKNPIGTACGIYLEHDEKHVFLLPGPPDEMRAVFKNAKEKYLTKFQDSVILSKDIKTFGIGESALAELIASQISDKNPTCATFCQVGESLVRITASAKTQDEAKSLLDKKVSAVLRLLGDFFYGFDDDTIEKCAVDALKSRGLFVTFAESLTGGMVSSTLINVPGASDVIKKSFVTYADSAKSEVLGVNEDILLTYGAVSSEVAIEMAQGALLVSGADVSVSLTGVAGPLAQGKNPAGTVYIAIADKNHTVTKLLKTGKADRAQNRQIATKTALFMLMQFLKNN